MNPSETSDEARGQAEAEASLATLRRFLRDRLPEHMVPALFVLMDGLPLTPTGKIDRKALEKIGIAALPGGAALLGAAGEAPATPVEEILAGIWSEVLEVPRPSRWSGFFELGGHSLLATQVQTRLRAAFQVELPLRTLFEEQTLAGLALAVERARQDGPGAALPPILPRDAAGFDLDGDLPLSFAQQRLWFIAQLEPDSPAYNVPVALRLSGRLDPALLAACLTELAARHETLRTTFVPGRLDPGRPMQRIAPPAPVPLPLVDLAGLPDPLAEAHRLGLEEELRPFDLARGPLMRATLLRLGEEEHAGFFNLHHIISDGWSTGILVEEMAALYGALRAGEPFPPVSLPPVPVQYADFALWQRAWLDGEVLEGQLAYWRQRLAGAPAGLDLPADRPRPALPSGRGAVRRPHLPADLAAALAAYGRREGATLFMVVLAGWKALLHRLTGETDLLVGSPIANRTRPEVERLIGFFVNTLVLRTDLAGAPSFRQAVGRVRETALAAYAHQDIPFERLVEELQPERSLSRTPFFQILVAFHNAPGGDLTLPGLTLSPLAVEGRTAKFDVALELFEAADGIRGRFEYSTDLFDAPTIDRLLGQWNVLLAGAMAEPKRALGSLPLLTAAERHQLVTEWTETARFAAGGFLAHQLFAAQAARNPERLAVVSEDGGISCGDLDRRAEALAARLRELGVGPDVPVGVFLSRGADLLVALLGILKAGGCYLPLDPAYPRERLAFMVRDTRAPFLVTEAARVGELPPHEAQVLILDDSRAASTPGVGDEPPASVVGAQFIAPASVRTENGTVRSTEPTLQEPTLPAERTSLAEDRAPLAGFADAGAMNCAPTTDADGRGNEDHQSRAVGVVREGDGLSPDHLAYIVYTSGSTGQPKGIALPHRMLANLVAWQLGDLRFRPGSGARTLFFASPSFDVSIQEIFATLCAGDTLVLASDEHRRDPEALLDRIEAARVQRLFLPFVALQQLAELAVRDGRAGELAIREVMAAGEQLLITPEIAALLAARPGAVLHNHYGPSETHVLTAHALSGPPESWPALPPIGKAIPGAAVYLVDRDFQPVPLGVPGQVLAGGVVPARGYLGRPDLTAERFLPDPWSPLPGARLYQVGDLARMRPDGGLDFLGRVDFQVKIRGYRVEPGEIEVALGRHPAVREAVVVVHGQGAQKRLVACVVPDRDGVDAETLRGYLRERLPDYMVPAAFLFLAAFPLTASGKVSRKQLVELAGESVAPAAGTAGAPPRNPIEEVLASLWAEVLQSGPVGIHDDFFSLGGHSLLATQVMSRIRRSLGVEVPLKALFETPTVAGLARQVEAKLQAGGGVAAAPMERRPSAPEDTAPLSFAQQRLWFLDQLEPGNSAYNLPVALRLIGRLDRAAMAASLTALAERHESLRTTFEPRADGPVQRIAPPAPFPLPFVDLAGLPEPLPEARRLADEEAARTFDLVRGPLLRATLVGLGPEEAVVLFTMHHIVSDGWSMGVLVREVAAFYEAFAAGRTPALPELPVQYADFARWQREHLQGEVLESQLAYWRRRLSGSPPALPLPTDHPRSARPTGRGGLRELDVPAQTAAGLAALARREGATLFMVLLAGWKALLHRYSGETDIPVGSPIANRNRAETEGLIGFFVNTLVLRTDLAGNPDLPALVARVRETTLGAYLHQDLPFERLVEELAPERSLAHTPFFQVMFVLQNTPMGALELPGLTLAPFPAEVTTAAFELTLSAVERGAGVASGGLGGSLEFDRDLFEPATADRLLGHFTTLLGGMAADPEARLSALPLLTDLERRQIVGEWNAGAADRFPPACLHELVAAQAERTPDAVALDYPGGSATYAELMGRVRRLGAFLRGIGVAPEVPVGVCAGSSPEMVTAMLGVWEAGGAYLPLDPSYPPERMSFLLGDSGARVVLVQRGVEAELPAGDFLRVELDFDSRAAPTLGVGDEPSASLVGAQFIAPAAVRTENRTVGTGDMTVGTGDMTVGTGDLTVGTGDLTVGTRDLAIGTGDPAPLTGHTDAGAMNCAPTRDADGHGDGDVWRRAAGVFSRPLPALPGNTAWIVYTSGSTGLSKGAAIEHWAGADYLRTVAQVWNLGPGERVLQFSSVSFDVCFEEVLPALFTGATVVLRGGHGKRGLDLWEPAEFLDRADELGLTAVELPSAYWHQWVQSFADRPSLPPGTTLRLVCAGGETMPPETARLWFRSPLAKLQLLNAYGPTEVVVGATLPVVEPGDATRAAIPIGRPLPGRTAYVVDRPPADTALLPVGVPGELLLGGILARGFVGRPALTAELFVPDPFSGRPGERLYRSGDLVRWLADGRLDILGRIDHQVKLRGFRIEPAEVEAALGAHPDVRDAAVLVRDDLAGGRGLVAYVVAEEGTAVSEPGLRDWIAERLPPYMVPAAFVALPSFPLNANGKVDRKALPAPVATETASGAADGLRDPVEQILAAIWSDVLPVDRLSSGDDFFALGGHSLLATQVVSRLRQAFSGIDLPLRVIFEAPTLGALAAAVRAALGSEAALPPPPPIEPVPRDGYLPLSFAQRRLWFLDQLDPGDPAYDIPAALLLTGELDVPALHAALREVVARHEALRTTFGESGGEPYQRIASPADFALPFVDLAGLPEAVREPEARRLADAETAWRFDLRRGPLLRAVLVRLDPEQHAAFLTMHHIVSDGWSTGVLIREVTALYGAFLEGRPSPRPPLPPLAVQYPDFAVWQRRWLQGEVLARHLEHWRSRLGGELPPLDLPVRPDAGPHRSNRGEALPFQLDPAAAESLRALARQEGASLFMVLTAALQAFLRRYSRTDRVVVGTDIAGRNRLETEALIGFFVNVLPLATDLGGDPTFREVVARVRETTLAAYTHQDLPFDILVQELQPERAGGGETTPLFQVLFVLQNAPEPALDLPGLRISGLPQPMRSTKFDLMLLAEETPGGVSGSWVYRTDLFDGAAVARLADAFSALLARLAAPGAPDNRLSRLEREGEAPAAMDTLNRKPGAKPDLRGRRAAARQSLDADRRDLVRKGDLVPGQKLPLLLQPAAEDVDLVDWAAAHRDALEADLLEHGALLFRGFGVTSAEALERFARVFVPELYGEYGDLPREAAGGEQGKIYSSTPYPPEQPILFHNESSQMHLWPMKQLFCCLEAAREGGETPVADGREVYRRLDPELRRRFRDRGLVYVRNFTAGIDVDWQEFFRTDDRAAVEAYCAAAGIACEWKENGDLTTRKQAPAVALHPKTGEAVFFNQIQAHHVSCLPGDVRESMLSIFGEANLPRNVYYGDGTPITAGEMDAVRAVYRDVAVEFPWQVGDVLMVDNMLTAHARNPFAGPRRILVAMGEMFRADDVRLPD